MIDSSMEAAFFTSYSLACEQGRRYCVKTSSPSQKQHRVSGKNYDRPRNYDTGFVDSVGMDFFPVRGEDLSQDEQVKDVTQEGTGSESGQIDSRAVSKWDMVRKLVSVQEWESQKQISLNFDGASDRFSSSAPKFDNKQSRYHNTIRHSISHSERWSTPSISNSSMDLDRGHARLPALSPTNPKPLNVRKQSGQVYPTPSQQQSNPYNPSQGHFETPVYPPRISSIRERWQPNESAQARATRIKTASAVDNSAQSTLSNYRVHYLSDTSIDVPSTPNTTARSILSSYKESYLSDLPDTSPGIMGDFVPIDSSDMAYRPAKGEDSKVLFHPYTSLSSLTMTITDFYQHLQGPKSHECCKPL